MDYTNKWYSDDVKLDYSDVLIVPQNGRGRSVGGVLNEGAQVQTRKDVNLLVQFWPDGRDTTKNPLIQEASAVYEDRTKKMNMEYYKQVVAPGANFFECIPIIASNMHGVGTPEVGKVMAENNMLTSLCKDITDEELDAIEDPDQYFLTVGLSQEGMHRLEDYCWKFKKVCIDVANGYLETLKVHVAKAREILPPNTFIMVGNVVTPEQAVELYHAGANCIKVGIGPGSVCTTRIKTGVGYPQLSAVMEIANIAKIMNKTHGRRMYVCADGGCTNPGDVAKAFVAGADFVMLGGMLAGHDEGGGEVETRYVDTGRRVVQEGQIVPMLQEKKTVSFYGMSSATANKKLYGELLYYRAAEGKEVAVEYKGKLQDTLDDLCGGLRSACTYVNLKDLKLMSFFGKLVKVNNQHNKVFDDA